MAKTGKERMRICCTEETIKPHADPIEMEILGFRLWMIIAFILTGLIFIVIVLCCIFNCRIPRTKQEIDNDHEKKRMLQRYKEQKSSQQQPSRGSQEMLCEPRSPPLPSTHHKEVPLASHPSAMVARGLPHPLAVSSPRPSQTGASRTLASFGDLVHKQV